MAQGEDRASPVLPASRGWVMRKVWVGLGQGRKAEPVTAIGYKRRMVSGAQSCGAPMQGLSFADRALECPRWRQVESAVEGGPAVTAQPVMRARDPRRRRGN